MVKAKVALVCCPVCESERGFTLVETIDEFAIYRCQKCEVQFADPMAYSRDLYEEMYSAGGENLVRVRRLSRSTMAEQSYRMLGSPQRLALQWLKQNLIAPAVVMDLGFGSGWFLAALEQQGYLAIGVEVASGPVELLRNKGFTVECTSLESLPSDWPRPKAIALFEVIEHLPNPVEFLRSLHQRFPDSPLLVSTPSPKRWSLHLGCREYHDYPPYHLIRWTERALVLALRKAGYADVECLYPMPDPAEFYSTILGMLFAHLRLLDVRCPGRAFRDDQGQLRLSRVVAKCSSFVLPAHDIGVTIFRTVFRPLAWSFHRLGWSSSSMLVVAVPS